jgi:hypothetical protein
MSGKMSVDIRKIVTTPRMTMSIDITTNVYGRLSAMRTSHIIDGLASVSPAARFDAEVGIVGAWLLYEGVGPGRPPGLFEIRAARVSNRLAEASLTYWRARSRRTM